ncbi:class I SAM-dependent methyltransferase [Paenibacillus kandeliae]|uniref:class I SAM-dependent methyltransferase n=1 Tax=Paenibacillus kandeliae TaxID=3231269 RepID=UPI0034593C82
MSHEYGVHERQQILDEIVNCMATAQEHMDVQRIQTEHRLKLVEFWDIQPGSSVLEIGCGQGDTTAVLAWATGSDGYVHGIDVATRDYGSPITVGDSANVLLASKLGASIRMEYEVDVLNPDTQFPEDAFDYVVISHASWYMASFEELRQILKRVRHWGKRLCFAEWDTRIQHIQQFPHLLAVLIQAKYECFKENSNANIRTLFTVDDIHRVAAEAGWIIEREQSIQSVHLQDGQWETDMVLDAYKDELEALSDIPDKLRSLIESEVRMLEHSVQQTDQIGSMATYVFVASRSVSVE